LPGHRHGETQLVGDRTVRTAEECRPSAPQPHADGKGAIQPAPTLPQQFAESLAGVGGGLRLEAVTDAPGLVFGDDRLVAAHPGLGEEHDAFKGCPLVAEAAKVTVDSGQSGIRAERIDDRAPAEDAELARDDAEEAGGYLARPGDRFLGGEVHVLPNDE